MLVLSRKKNESIIIGPNGEIEIVVVAIRGDKVRLGITADTMDGSKIPVHRQEVFETIQHEAKKAVDAHNEASGFTEPAVTVPG